MKKKKIVCAALVSLLCLASLGFKINHASAEGSEFSATPMLPKTQKGDSKGFYDIQLDNEKPFQLELAISNDSDHERLFALHGFNAVTNINGIIDYSNAKLKDQVYKGMRLTDYMKVPKDLKIPAKQAKTVTVKITPPKKAFKGYILGSIQVAPEVKKNPNGISNSFTRTIAVRMWGTQSPKGLKPEFKDVPKDFNLKNDKEPLIYYTLKNDEPRFEKGVKIQTILTYKNKKERLTQQDYAIDFAPSSFFKQEQKLTKKLADGDYTFHVETRVDSKKQSEHLYTFTIKNGKLKQRISIAVLLVLLFLFLLFLCALLYYLTRRKKDENDDETTETNRSE